MNGRQALAKRNADGYFDIYLAMGPHRSLEKLHTTLANGGLKLTLNTLKNYSSRYGWQSRLRAAEEMAQAQLDEERDAERLLSMNERQANYGELSQRLAGHYLGEIFQRIREDPKSVRGSPTDITRLLAEGSRMERLARGEVTNRTEARVHAYGVMVRQITEVFINVAKVYDLSPDAVEDFVRGADLLVAGALAEEPRGEGFERSVGS